MGNGRFCRMLEPIVEIIYADVACCSVRVNAIPKLTSIIKNITMKTPKGITAKNTVIDTRRQRKIKRNHFAHICGHLSESGSRFEIDTVITVAKKIKGAITIAPALSTSAVMNNARAIKGDVTRAIAGFLNPRYIYTPSTIIAITSSII
jgi:hypothetical protein